ncbi:MAG: SO_0444 family Cu/Zn efflux transporter [Proteobacteria bacterium]|nr:SO_0444 family Cu/Zn efflux transporter [Pseudomonadota bacterium]MBU1420775.1 SO_0444 family Cu/Zn efflux transporter [Pseudomonadota bacterium]MBU1456877.1 SO_0444 family Cu/Zn efflux transporter [Pseudomonadota bacterium]
MNFILFITDALEASWQLLLQSAPYMLFGLLVGGLLKVFLSQEFVNRHLGSGRFSSVIKASLLGIPIPLCSCGVLPAAASLKKQGANKGATAAFLISTPESGVDSIAITYALLDPIMTVARPIAAFVSAMAAGIGINLLQPPATRERPAPAPPTPLQTDCGCSGTCSASKANRQPGLMTRLGMGIRYAATDIWGDLAGWFFVGILAAGIITVLIPDEIIASYLGGGLSSMLLMLCLGIPLYICATASTPIAAAFILKGVSPGTALVFLLVGPATNITSLSVLFGILGKQATAIYLTAIAVFAVLCGLALDLVYASLGISAIAIIGEGSKALPPAISLAATLLLLILSILPLAAIAKKCFSKKEGGCGCSGSTCSTTGHI